MPPNFAHRVDQTEGVQGRLGESVVAEVVEALESYIEDGEHVMGRTDR